MSKKTTKDNKMIIKITLKNHHPLHTSEPVELYDCQHKPPLLDI